MSTNTALVTISFRRPGTQPPVFVAGSFTDPPWQLRQMQCTRDDSGENHFTVQVSVQPGQEYTYKFKVGDDGDWVLDQHASIATHDDGSKANSLKVPGITDTSAGPLQTPLEATERKGSSPHPGLRGTMGGVSHAPAKSHVSKTLNIETQSQREGSRTPIEIVAKTAAEVADTAAKLDDPESPTPDGSGTTRGQGDTSGNEGAELQTPLFAHECFGAYEFVDDGLDHHEVSDKVPKSMDQRLSLSDYEADSVDPGDPTVERFPSDRSSVMDTLRKIQSCTDEHRLHLEDLASRRTSVDSSDGSTSLGSLSPTSTRRRENRLSHSSFGHTKSALSLGSIAEEPKPGENGADKSQHARQRMGLAVYDSAITPPTDDDEPLTMKV
ncbi:curved DNA-binding protein [Purpureocillium lavendulum]|uniref:Curved DNA-binding protein n=1 Tax=Purpureocillium lavendulum TaxID=1247861 RepID=A0AB34G773_9HYPO|nr:curved DNA-binding protein [Purpureocillium lavendulum]